MNSSNRFCAVAMLLCIAPAGCSGDSSGVSGPMPARPDAGVADSEVLGPEILAIDSGRVRGVRGEGVWIWKGIPYAAPPIGNNRWREPQPVAHWEDIRDGSKFGEQCIQTPLGTGGATGSEDCLTLNVWRPDSSPPQGGWPVMFFIHGGYNVRGSSSAELELDSLAYDGTKISQRNVVFVSINYRLGALGWMGHPALSAESSHRSSGNYAALDQVSALQWVQRNAKVLGADPSRVLIFGQSAGGTNTCGLVSSTLSRGLFSRAIMHSGTCAGMGAGKHEEAGTKIAETLGCSNAPNVIECLRAKPAPEVASAAPLDFRAGGFAWGHAVDGYFLPATMPIQISTGVHNRVPMIVSVTAHETTTLWSTSYPTVPIPKSPADHESAMRAIFGSTIAEQVIAKYPASAYPSPALASVAATTDAIFLCPARGLSRALARSQAAPVRRFYFGHVLASGTARAFGAAHGFDLLFVFPPKGVSWFQPTPGETALADTMIGYWTRFAATGDPNGDGAVAWPSYDSVTDSHLAMDATFHLGTNLRTSECDFWASL